MKTEELIEKGLECCATWGSCPKCPYNIEGEIEIDKCTRELAQDLVAHINRLKDRIAELEAEKAVSDRVVGLVYNDVYEYGFVKNTRLYYTNQAKQELEKESK